MAIENEKQKMKLDQEKSLEEVIQEKGFNYTPEEVSEKINLIKEMKHYKSSEAAEEYLKQSIINGINIDKEIEINRYGIIKNHSERLIKKLEYLAKKEKESLTSLIEPFLKDKKLVPEKTSVESVRLGWYSIMGSKRKYEALYKQLEQRTLVSYLNNNKDFLKSKRHESNRLYGLYDTRYKESKIKMKSNEDQLKNIRSDLKMSIKSKKKLEFERTELEKLLDNEENIEDIDKIDEHYEKINEDIEIINEESLNLYEDSKIYRMNMLELKMELETNKQLKTFYRRSMNSYNRYITTMSDLMVKIRNGMSYEKAHDVAKEFTKNEQVFDKYTSMRKELLENADISLDLTPVKIKDIFPETNLKAKKMETICIDSAPEEIDTFLKNIRKH